MVVTVFRNRLRSDVDPGYEKMALETFNAARGMPGFVSFKTFTADDGERVAIVEFESLETQQAWREHALHRRAQQGGREQWYAWYDIKVCEVVRAHAFTAED